MIVCNASAEGAADEEEKERTGPTWAGTGTSMTLAWDAVFFGVDGFGGALPLAAAFDSVVSTSSAAACWRSESIALFRDEVLFVGERTGPALCACSTLDAAAAAAGGEPPVQSHPGR